MNLDDILYEDYNKVAIFMMGAPGAGKSHWIKRNVPSSYRWVNPDAINRLFHGPGNKPATLPKSFNLAKRLMKQSIERNRSFVFDGTGANPKTMRELFDLAKSAGYTTKLVYIDVPVELALKQNRKRERQIPDKAIEAVWKKVQDSFYRVKNFAWDKVIVVKRSSLSESFFRNLDTFDLS